MEHLSRKFFGHRLAPLSSVTIEGPQSYTTISVARKKNPHNLSIACSTTLYVQMVYHRSLHAGCIQ